MTTVTQFNAVLNKHGALLEAIWDGSVSVISEENARRISELKAAQVVITDDEGHVRLTRPYRDLLERCVGRRGNYASTRSINDDISRLRAVAIEANDAWIEKDEVTHNEAMREGSDIIWELADTLQSTITGYEQLLHNGLGGTGSREARIKRTDYAISRLKEVSHSVTYLIDGPAREVLDQQSCRDLRREYGRLIIDKIDDIVKRVTRTANELYRLVAMDREIMAETRRARAMFRLLRDVSITDRTEVLLANNPIAPKLPAILALRIDPLDDETGELRNKLARQIKPAERRAPRKVEEAGTLVIPPASEAQEIIEPDVLIAEAFEAEVYSGKSVSLRKFLSDSEFAGDANFAFEAIMTGVLAEPAIYKVCFDPPLDAIRSSRIHDIIVETR